MTAREYNRYGWACVCLNVLGLALGVSAQLVSAGIVVSAIWFAASDILKAIGK